MWLDRRVLIQFRYNQPLIPFFTLTVVTHLVAVNICRCCVKTFSVRITNCKCLIYLFKKHQWCNNIGYICVNVPFSLLRYFCCLLWCCKLYLRHILSGLLVVLFLLFVFNYCELKGNCVKVIFYNDCLPF